MNETTKKLLELISQGKTVNQISDTMGISHKRLFNYLTMIRNKGFNFDRKYYDTGDIVYVPKKLLFQRNIRELILLLIEEVQVILQWLFLIYTMEVVLR